MIEQVQLWLRDEQITDSCGKSLAHTLHGREITILLDGELGAGKTTFIKGFAEELGIRGPVTSPTFALEQRYSLPNGGTFGHIDLYRLTSAQANELIRSGDEHFSIRCIEWSERLSDPPAHAIRLHLSEENGGRTLSVTFDDFPLPSLEEISDWQKEVALPQGVIDHCNVVGTLAETLAHRLLEHGTLVRPQVLRRAGEVHDLLRFLDFRQGGAHSSDPLPFGHESKWAAVRRDHANLSHEEACAFWLQKRGFTALADIVEVHGLSHTSPRTSIEQKVLYYADKRVMADTVVTIDERFADFQKRYASGPLSTEQETWLIEVREMERLLFPEGAPM